jgi:amino acid adenylation domain-containing protein
MAKLGPDQQRFLVACQVEEDPRANHLWIVARLTGPIKLSSLEDAWRQIWKRNDVLRMHWGSERENSQPSFAPQEGCPTVEVSASVQDPTAWAEEVIGRRFDLSKPWSRFEIARMSEVDCILALVLPRASLDVRSLRLIFDEFVQFYGGTVEGETNPPKKGLSEYLKGNEDGPKFDPIALRQASSILAGDLPSLDLPSKWGSRPAAFSGRGRTIERSLDVRARAALDGISRKLGLSVAEINLTVFASVLQRFSNQEDFTVGVLLPKGDWQGIAPNETRCVLRVSTVATTKLDECARSIADAYRAAHSRTGAPFQELVQAVGARRDPSRTALYQAAFEFGEPLQVEQNAGGVLFREQMVENTGAATDLTIKIQYSPERAHVLVEYATDILSEDTARSILESHCFALAAFEAHLGEEMGRLPVMDGGRQEKSYFPLRPTAFDANRPVFLKLSEHARLKPQTVAAVMNGVELSYAELEKASNRLAHRLRKQGVGEDSLVGVYCERSLDMLVALLATHKAGGAYVPLDPKHPAERIKVVLEDAAPQVLITQSSMRDSCPTASEVCVIEIDDPALNGESERAPVLEFNPEALAYVIFTSGSTGRPKGVEISHRAFTNFIVSMASSPGMAQSDRVLSVTTLSFDIAGLELMLPLFVGGSVEIADHETCIDAEQLKERIADPTITLLQATPATFRMLIESSWVGKPNLKVLCGGEAFPPDLVRSLLKRTGEVWNVYGPTETTVWSTLRRLTDDTLPISIGRPIDNTSVYLLNPCQVPVPRGAVGEIWIGGTGVARGYHKRPDLTAERFVADPFCADANARMYRTGDLGRISSEGELVCLGRVDFQVKIRGFRIELGDIESALLDHEDVAQAVVVAREDTPGDKRLVAYVVATGTAQDLSTRLRNSLRDSLPAYMIPASFVVLDALPLNPSGKIDRKALPQVEQSREQNDGDDTAATNDTEISIRAVFSEILGTTQFSLEDSFFDVGGNSLLAVRLVRDLEAALGVKIPLSTLFENSSVRGIAKSIDDGGQTSERPRVVKLRRGDSDDNVFCIYGVALYQHLARLLPKRYGVYGVYVPIEAKMFDADSLRRGEVHIPSVADLAASYLEAIRAQQPKGPYRLLGLSFGGVIAYEASKILQSQGEEVHFLGLLDALLPQAVQLGGLRRKLSLVREFAGNAVGWSTCAKLGLGRLGFSQKREFTETQLEWLRDRINTVQVHRYAANTHKYSGNVILVHAGDRGDFRDGVVVDAAAGWRDWIAGTIHEYVVPGRHLAIVEHPHVEKLAADLSLHMENQKSAS